MGYIMHEFGSQKLFKEITKAFQTSPKKIAEQTQKHKMKTKTKIKQNTLKQKQKPQ